MSMSTFLAGGLLDLVLNNAQTLANLGDATGPRGSATAGSLYIGLHTADVAPGDAQTVNEATFTGYARKAVARASAFTSSGMPRTNVAQQDFVAASPGSPTNLITHWSIGVASSGGSVVLFSGPLAGAPKAFTATTADVLTAPGHSLINGDRVVLYEQPGATIPTGLTRGAVYYVVSVSGNTFSLALTSGGAAIDITAAGAGVVQKLTPLVVGEGVTPTIAAGAMSISLA